MSSYTFLPQAYLNTSFIPFHEAQISIATHALHYGTAVWGGIRALYDTHKDAHGIFRLHDHATRLSQSAKFLEYNIPAQTIFDTICEFVKQNKVQTDLYIRPMIYTSDLGIVPRVHDMKKDFLIYGIEFNDYFDPSKRLKLCFSSWMRQEDISLPLRGKVSGAYITSAMAKTEAYHRGFDDAILLNTRHKVSECTGANIFMYRQNQLVTPPVTSDILEGITRKTIRELAIQQGIDVIERDIDKTELLLADEVFITGTAAKITPVGMIEHYQLPSDNPITTLLQSQYAHVTRGEIDNNSPSFLTYV